MNAMFIIKVGSGRTKTVGGVAFLKFPAPYGSVFIKFQSATKFLADCQKNTTFYSPMTTLFVKTFGSDRMKTVGGVAF